MNALSVLKSLLAVYNAVPKETRKEIGAAIAQIPEFFVKIVDGDPIDLDSITPVMTSEEMEKQFYDYCEACETRVKPGTLIDGLCSACDTAKREGINGG
jgi:hypothetical protein